MSILSPPFPVIIAGRWIFIWDKQVANILRRQYRIISKPFHPTQTTNYHTKKEEQESEIESNQIRDDYLDSSPPYLLLPEQAYWLYRQQLIIILDGTDFSSLLEKRFVHSRELGISDGEASKNEREMILRQEYEQKRKKKIEKTNKFRLKETSTPQLRNENNNHPEDQMIERESSEERINKEIHLPVDELNQQTYPSDNLVADEINVSTVLAETDFSEEEKSKVPLLSKQQKRISQYPEGSSYLLAYNLFPQNVHSLSLPVPRLPLTLTQIPSPSSSSTLELLLPLLSPYHCVTFAALHARHYFITSASQFACDYALYSHDPFECHSEWLVTVNFNETINVGHVKRLQRLAESVRKELIIACVQKENCENQGFQKHLSNSTAEEAEIVNDSSVENVWNRYPYINSVIQFLDFRFGRVKSREKLREKFTSDLH